MGGGGDEKRESRGRAGKIGRKLWADQESSLLVSLQSCQRMLEGEARRRGSVGKKGIVHGAASRTLLLGQRF